MPQSNGRLAIALLVVAAGAALAWTFRQPDTPVEDASASAGSRGIVYRESPPPVVNPATTPIPTANLSVPDPFAAGNSAAQPAPTTPQRTFAAASADGLINVVPRDPGEEGPSAIPHVARRIPPIGTADRPTLPANPPQPPDMNGYRGTSVRQHKIADGDSLADLAVRYLNDPNRANEIYELNRDLLPGMDMLPIGVTIVIPRDR